MQEGLVVAFLDEKFKISFQPTFLRCPIAKIENFIAMEVS